MFFLLTNELQSGSKKEMRITLCNSVHGSKELSIYLSSLVFGLRSPPPSSFSGGRQAKHKFSRGKNAWTKSFKEVCSNQMDFGQDRGLARLALLFYMSLRVSSFIRVWPETWKRTMEILGNFPKWGFCVFSY